MSGLIPLLLGIPLEEKPRKPRKTVSMGLQLGSMFGYGYEWELSDEQKIRTAILSLGGMVYRISHSQDLSFNFELKHEIQNFLTRMPPSTDDLGAAVILAAGITQDEIKSNEKPDVEKSGSLDELKASVLSGGPFKIALTPHPSEHLTFRERGGRSYILVLDLRAVFRFIIPQRLGLSQYISL